MTSAENKKSDEIEKLDRISELPEPMILDILSRLPLEDSARASILSKTWKSYCALHPILYYDHNLFALQSMVGGGEPDINQIRDMFLDNVDYQLSRARQLDSPIRKIALKVAINDSKCFSRLDTCLEMLRLINVEDLCVIVQTIGYLWEDVFYDDSIVYEFPFSVLASKGLRSMYIQGCKFAEETFVGDPINKRGVSFSSLQRLCLSHVYIKDHVFENRVNYCPGVEMLVLDYCTFLMDSIELSRFPKLKNAVIDIEDGWIDRVGIEDTRLDCFKCVVNTGSECHISPAACASIRELTLVGCTINQPSVFADLAATFHASPRYNVHLTLYVTPEAGQNVAALVDALLWIIRPTTLIVGVTFCLLKYLCENLAKKSQDNFCGEQVTSLCWLDQLEDFQVESSLDIQDMKENLLKLPEQCRSITKDIRFKFLWS